MEEVERDAMEESSNNPPGNPPGAGKGKTMKMHSNTPVGKKRGR